MHHQAFKYIFASLLALFCTSFVFTGYYTFFQQEEISRKETTTEHSTNDTEGSGCDYVSIVGDDMTYVMILLTLKLVPMTLETVALWKMIDIHLVRIVFVL